MGKTASELKYSIHCRLRPKKKKDLEDDARASIDDAWSRQYTQTEEAASCGVMNHKPHRHHHH